MNRYLLPVVSVFLLVSVVLPEASAVTISAISLQSGEEQTPPPVSGRNYTTSYFGALQISGDNFEPGTLTGTLCHLATENGQPDNKDCSDIDTNSLITATAAYKPVAYAYFTTIVKYTYSGSVPITLKMVSSCGLKVWSPAGCLDREKETLSFNVPGSSTCSVEINTTPSIPEITPGKRLNAVNFTSNAIGTGYLTFKPDAYDNNGGLLKGGDGNTLNYSVVDSASGTFWNAADAQWRGDLTRDYLVQLAEIPLSTAAGTYKGTMTATVSCE